MKNTLIGIALAVLCFTAGAAEARGYGHHGYRHGGHHHGTHVQSLIGGVVLGALLTTPRYAAPAPAVVYVSRPAPVVATTAPPVATGVRQLLRDSNGNCFERRRDPHGREYSVSLSPAECM